MANASYTLCKKVCWADGGGEGAYSISLQGFLLGIKSNNVRYQCTKPCNVKHHWPDLHLMTPIRFYGTPKSAIEKGIRKNFLTRSAPCSQIDRHFLQKFIFQAHGGKFSQPSVKFQAMKWIPFFGFAERREIWKASGVVKVVVVVCMECKIASQNFCPLLPPNGPPLVILDHWRFSLPLNGSPGCGGKMKKVHSVVSAHCKSVASSVWWGGWWETTADHQMVTSSPTNWLNMKFKYTIMLSDFGCESLNVKIS